MKLNEVRKITNTFFCIGDVMYATFGALDDSLSLSFVQITQKVYYDHYYLRYEQII